MKMKTLATLTAAGLLAVSLAYVTPALAEEAFDEDVGNQQFALADNSSSGQAMPADMGGDMGNATDNSGNVSPNSMAPRQEASAAPQPYDPNQNAQQQQVVQQPGAYQQSASNNTNQQGFNKAANAQQNQQNPQNAPIGQQSANNTSAAQPASPNAPAGDQATADVPSGDEDF